MQASRLLSILMLLQARGRMTAPALAVALEVSVRTILRDIDQLSAAGVPLWGDRGRNGGFQLQAGWSTHLTGLTEPEANALLLAGLPGAATELGVGAAAASARLKLVASLPPEWRAQAERVGARLHVDSVDWYRVQETPVHLQAVADAVWNSWCIDIQYESWRGVVQRELEPLGLILKAGAWYMAAREAIPAARNAKAAARSARGTVGGANGMKVRTYRLANVLELQSGRRHFKWPRRFDLAGYWRESTARFEAELYRLQARLRVSPRGLKWLQNSRSKLMMLPKAAGPKPGQTGWLEVLVPIESVEHGARQFLAFADEAEVLEPLELREKILRDAEAISARYRT
jgi:predicted DNA-binding transcriptional regulator YafY